MPCSPRTLAATGILAALLTTTTACTGSTTKPGPAQSPAPSNEASAGEATEVEVTFGQDEAAVNYDKSLVPDNAKLFVASLTHDGLTTVVLNVRGLLPDRVYGAHAHAKPCGAKPEESGPHFQHSPDPVQPSVDPAFANSRNEIWLDFTTDARGAATVSTTVDWTFGREPAGSVVLHAEKTRTAPGQAGVAGARVACASVGF